MKNFMMSSSVGLVVSFGLVSCGGDGPRQTRDAVVDDVTSDVSVSIDADPGDADPSSDVVIDQDIVARPDVVAETDTVITEDVETPGDVVTSACSASNRMACLYRPDETYQVQSTTIDDLTYQDITGATRSVHVAIYRPRQAPTPMPIVLLSHGGSSGKTDPMKSMEHWAPVFAGAGYLTFAIAHEGRDEASYAALCAAVAVNPDHPCGLKVSWDRPNDLARVIEFIKDSADDPQFEGIADISRMAHVGHSAGAGAALMSVGAKRNFKCALPFGFEDPDQDCQVADLVSFAHPDIDVAVSLSLQGPGSEGFMAESYDTINKPVLIATGANDGGSPEEVANRLAAWPLLPEGDNRLFFIDDQGAKHTLFEGSVEACEPIAGAAKCAAMRDAVFAMGLAFVDAHLNGSARAAAWLESGDIVTAGQGLFETDSK